MFIGAAMALTVYHCLCSMKSVDISSTGQRKKDMTFASEPTKALSKETVEIETLILKAM